MSWLSSEDRTTFLACLCISCMIWLLSALSENYETGLTVDIEFTNFPEDQILVKAPDSTLYLIVNATGNDLMRSLGFNRPKLSLDYNKLKTNSLSTESFIKEFEEQLPEIKIVSIKPEKIYLDLEEKSIKKVPIHLVENIETARRFEIIDQIIVEPDSVVVTGPKSIVDTILYLPTEKVVKTDVSQSGSDKTSIQKSNFPKSVQINQQTVEYFYKVEEFTEKRINVPISVENLQSRKSVVLYPRSVEVLCLVPTREYNEIDKTYFAVVADFSNVDLVNHQKVPLEVMEQPINAKAVRILTKQADFIVFEI